MRRETRIPSQVIHPARVIPSEAAWGPTSAKRSWGKRSRGICFCFFCIARPPRTPNPVLPSTQIVNPEKNKLYYGDNYEVLQRYAKDESVDLVYLDPPFNSRQDYNVLFAEKDGSQSSSQIHAFEEHLGVEHRRPALLRVHRRAGRPRSRRSSRLQNLPLQLRHDGLLSR